MQLDDFRIAYDIVNNFKKYDTVSNPPKINTLVYQVPKIEGIHPKLWSKSIDEVKLNTLEYILYYLHNIDEDKVISTLIALLYYWRIRKRKQAKMDEVYQEVIKHYTIENKVYCDTNTCKGKCVYLVKIYIGSMTLYKVGQAIDLHQRMINLQSDIKSSYPLVSVGMSILAVKLCDNSDKLEEIILSEAKSKITKKHKFNFKGYTEAFKSESLIAIFNNLTKKTNSKAL
jgi:hypothetical protein